MTRNSLKIQIVVTLVLFLLIGMVSVSVVWVTFLQRQMVSSEIKRLENSARLAINGLQQFFPRRSEDVVEQLQALFLSEQISCYQVEHSGEIIAATKGADCQLQVVKERALEATGGYQQSLTFSGSAWSVFTITHKYAQLVVQLTVPALQSDTRVTILTSLAPVYAELREKTRVIIIYGMVALLILAALYYFRISLLVFKPICNLIDKTDTYSSQADLFLSLQQTTNEFGHLSVSIQQMIKRIQADKERLQALVVDLQQSNKRLEENKKEMVQAEKLASIGKLAAGLAHEIGNPLGIIQGYVDMLGSTDLDESDRRQFALRADKELQRISGLIRQLLDFSRNSSGIEKRIVNVPDVLSRVVDLVMSQRSSRSLSIERILPQSPLEVLADEDQLQQVFLNCLLNSVEAVSGTVEGPRSVQVVCEGDGSDDTAAKVRVIITDTGPGLDEVQLRHAFDPFFTTREPGRGTGLGLYVSYAIIETLGGSIAIGNAPSGGARVEIQLPIAGKS